MDLNTKIALLAQLLDAALDDNAQHFTDLRRLGRHQGLSQARDLFQGVFARELEPEHYTRQQSNSTIQWQEAWPDV